MTAGVRAFDVPTQMWLERYKHTHRDEVADAVRCPSCLRGVRNGSEADLAASCRNARPHSALPCPMAVNHDGGSR